MTQQVSVTYSLCPGYTFIHPFLYPIIMMLDLKNAQPLYKEATRLSPKALQVYLVLWQSACMSPNGTTEWTVKGIAGHTGSKRETISKAIALLIDDGLITVAGYAPSNYGSKHTVFRVTHPSQLEAVRYAADVIGKPSEAWKAQMKARQNLYEPYSISDDGCNFNAPVWKNYEALYPDNVLPTAMKSKYNMNTVDYFSRIVLWKEKGVCV